MRHFLICLFFIVSSCDFSNSEKDEVQSLNDVYNINEWALILNTDNTFKLDEYPRTYGKFPYDCTPKPFERPSTKIQRVVKMPDSLKGTYYIKNNRLYLDKIYRVITVKIHDYEHDTIFLKSFKDKLYKYEMEKIKENEESRKFNDELRRNKENSNIFFLYPKDIFFNYPQPTEKYLSYVYDTIYYNHPSQIDIKLSNVYSLDSIQTSNNDYIDNAKCDVYNFINRKLIRENITKEFQKSNITKSECQCEISFHYFINESSRVDSFQFYLSDCCSKVSYDKSKAILSRMNNWPKGTLFGKPVKYYYFDSFVLEK